MNPAMDTPEVRADIGRIRMAELKASTDIIGYDDTVLARLPRLGHARLRGQQEPCIVCAGPARGGGGAASLPSSAASARRSSSPTATTRPSTRILTICGCTRFPSWRSTPPVIRTCYPEAGAPFAPSKLYYSVWSGERFRLIHEKFFELGLESPFDDKWLKRMTQTEPFTTTIDVAGYTHVRAEALKAHATQVDPKSPFWFGLPPEVMRDIHPVDEFRLAQSRVGPDRHDRGRPLRRPALLLIRAQAVGPRSPQLMMPALWSNTRATAAARTQSRVTVTTALPRRRRSALVRRRTARRSASVGRSNRLRLGRRLGFGRGLGLGLVLGLGQRRGLGLGARVAPATMCSVVSPVASGAGSVCSKPAVTSRITTSRSSRVQPRTTRGVTAPSPRSVSRT